MTTTADRRLELTTEQFSQLYREILQSVNGRHTMTAKELCQIDDLCTTLIVDPLVRFKSHKMNLEYEPPNMQSHLLCLSIMLQYIYDGDLLKVYFGMYSLKITQDFLKDRSVKAKEHVRDHLLRFVAMFRYDAGYTIVPCCRYGHEGNVGAKLIATRYWKKDDVIDQLIGVIGNLTHAEEEELLIPGVNDFSVLISQRKKRPQLWLGPGAFLNHDCSPNCEFLANKNNTAVIHVLRDINPGDELFIYYGPAFFGENNELCECETCEKKLKGAFRKNGTQQTQPNPQRGTRGASPTPSMMSTYTIDAAGYERRKYALRARKQINEEEVYFDSKEFFQKVILDRFINCPLISGTENIKAVDSALLSSFKFNPRGLPVINKTDTPAIDLLIDPLDRFEPDMLIPDKIYCIEEHFSKPLKSTNDVNAANLLAFLGFNVCILEDSRLNPDRQVRRKNSCAMSTARPWEKHIQSMVHRRPLTIKKKKNTPPRQVKSYLSKKSRESIIAENMMECFREWEEFLKMDTALPGQMPDGFISIYQQMANYLGGQMEEELSEDDSYVEEFSMEA